MDVLEILFGLAVLLLAYLGPLLSRLFLKDAGKRAGEGREPDGLLGDDSRSDEAMELGSASAPSPLVQDARRPARGRPPPRLQARQTVKESGVGGARRRRIDARLIGEIVILEAFLASPRSLRRH